MIKTGVEEVLRHLREEFPDSTVSFIPGDNGGGDVIVEDVDVGEGCTPAKTWIGANLSPQLPFSDVYPLFIGGNVMRRNGTPLGGPTSACQFASRPAIQVSRRTNNLVATPHAAAMKFRKVLTFVKELAP
ncbi:MAG: hypothetical protein Q7K57_11960 [Burkholderiaceae bacterium]|nr:hypothetical protein [Burkholderiaceae bacterium]